MSCAPGWLATCQPERAECSRSLIVQRYLHGPGTGVTNLPSFSATKFSELLDELPLPSFFSTLMTSFRRFEIQANFAGWSVHRCRRFFSVLRREINKVNVGNFLEASSDCIIL